MKKKKTKKKEPQVIEIHIYVHQNNVTSYPIYVPPNGGAGGTQTPPFNYPITTC